MEVSTSSVEIFLRCRRQFNFSSFNRMALRPIMPSLHTAFHVGTSVHKALEAQISLSHRPNTDAIIDDEERELETYYKSIVGSGWSSEERDLLSESRILIKGMVNHYFDNYGEVNPLGKDYRYKHAEITFKVPIPTTEHYFIGTIDGIAEHVPSKEIYLVEHKTTSTAFPDISDLQISRQMQAYTWAAGILLGFPVAGIVYDGILKKIPMVPELNKNGSLSKAAIITTPKVYKQAINAIGANERDYVDILEKLNKHKFFYRVAIRYTKASLKVLEQNLIDLANDMSNPDLPLYPNKPWQGCHDCSYQDLCVATQMGEDISAMLKYKYAKAVEPPSRLTPPITHLELG